MNGTYIFEIVNRTIVPSATEELAVVNDNDSRYITFKIPSVIDGIDITDKILTVRYVNSLNRYDQFFCNTREVVTEGNEQFVLFDWVLSADVTASKGTVTYDVSIYDTNDISNVSQYILHTKPATFEVDEGLLDVGAPIEDENALQEAIDSFNAIAAKYYSDTLAASKAAQASADAAAKSAASLKVDTTLTIFGYAADAKTVGDKLAGKAESSEVTSIRNDLQSEIDRATDMDNQIKEDLDDFAPKVWAKNITDELSFEVGYYDPIQKIIIKDETYLHAVVKASKGDVFFYDGYSTYDGRLYVLVKDKTILEYYPADAGNGNYLVGNKIEINTDCELYLNTRASKLEHTILYKISNNTNVEILDWNTYNIFDVSRLKDGLIGPTYGSLFHFYDNNKFLHLPYIVKCEKGDIIRAKFKWYGLIFLDDYFKVANSVVTSDNYAFEISDDTVHYVSVYVEKKNSNAYQVITINHDIPNYYVPYGVKQLDSEAQMRRNLKWCALGDSITDANTLKNDSHGNKNYVDFVKKSLEVNAINNGVGGTGYIANNGGASKTFIQRIDDIPSDAELITVFGSFNDVYQGFELGTINDNKTETTLYGKLKEFYEALFNKRPNAIVGLIVPTPWETCCRYNTGSDKYEKTIQYVTALLDIAKLYSIPVLNLFDESDLRPYDSVFKKEYYRDNNDNVHPNQKGHEKYISPKIVDFIRKITMYD